MRSVEVGGSWSLCVQAQLMVEEIKLFFTQIATNSEAPDHQAPSRYNDAPVGLLSTSFIGRERELDQIQERLNIVYGDSPSRCALYGMPGVGKTQLALKYTVVSFSERRYSYIFWISATTTEKLYQGLVKILDLLKLPDRFNPDQSAKLTATQQWLENRSLESEARWLLVLDNASRHTLRDIRNHLPRTNSAGSILFTTRTADLADALAGTAGERNSSIELQTPNLSDATRMLLCCAGIEESFNVSKAQGVVNSVGRLPLAVDQAASFMKQTHASFDDLLDIYSGEQKSQVSISVGLLID
jgi:Cdc6-like AAA superfamily ATPase